MDITFLRVVDSVALDFLDPVPALALSVVIAYVLGAVPLADRLSRRRGIDIYSVGTRRPGAANVRRSVGPRSAALVLLGDLAKGALAVTIAISMGVQAPWILVPAAVAIFGHWSSVFSGFRGGDGLATLGGVTIALFPLNGLACVTVAAVVSLGGQKMPYTSLLGLVFGYIALIILSLAFFGDTALTLGAGGLAAMVLAKAMRGHMVRRRVDDWADAVDADGATEQTSL